MENTEVICFNCGLAFNYPNKLQLIHSPTLGSFDFFTITSSVWQGAAIYMFPRAHVQTYPQADPHVSMEINSGI